MRFEEALPLMREGRKFQRPRWGELYVTAPGGCVVDDNGAATVLGGMDVCASDWEEVRTPWRNELKDGSFAEALVGMARGETWTRRSGNDVEDHMCFADLDSDDQVTWSVDDYLATDWERVP